MVILKIIIYVLVFWFVVGLSLALYAIHSSRATRAEICDQATIGQKLEFKNLIEKYVAKGAHFSFSKENEQTKMLSGKKLDADDVAYLTDMTGRFSFRISRGFGHYICQIHLKNGLVESKKLTGFD